MPKHEILCKKESEEARLLIWKIHFPVEVVLNSLQTQKDLEHICQLSRIERETDALLYHLTHWKWVSFLTQIYLSSIITWWCRHFVDLLFFIYSRLINAICTCWTTHAYNCCDNNYVSTKEGVIFGEQLIYLRSHNTRRFGSSYGLIISSIFSDNEEKVTIWIAPLICL